MDIANSPMGYFQRFSKDLLCHFVGTYLYPDLKSISKLGHISKAFFSMM